MKIEPNNIYLGDCYELIKHMEDKSVNLVLCDPPYLMETGGHGTSDIAVRFRERYKELENLKLDVGMDMSFLKELERVCKYIYIYMVQQKSIVQFNRLLPQQRRYKYGHYHLGKDKPYATIK